MAAMVAAAAIHRVERARIQSLPFDLGFGCQRPLKPVALIWLLRYRDTWIPRRKAANNSQPGPGAFPVPERFPPENDPMRG